LAKRELAKVHTAKDYIYSELWQWDNLHYYPEVVPDDDTQQGGLYQDGQIARSIYLANIHGVGGNNFSIA